MIFKNPPKDQVATKMPIEGEFSNASIGTWEAVFELLKKRLHPGPAAAEVEDNKPGLLKRIFTNKDTENKKAKKEERKENGKEKKDKQKKDK